MKHRTFSKLIIFQSFITFLDSKASGGWENPLVASLETDITVEFCDRSESGDSWSWTWSGTLKDDRGFSSPLKMNNAQFLLRPCSLLIFVAFRQPWSLSCPCRSACIVIWNLTCIKTRGKLSSPYLGNIFSFYPIYRYVMIPKSSCCFTCLEYVIKCQKILYCRSHSWVLQ
jgi:hypothetical protein